MTMTYLWLWYVLAGFLLGFVTSTLWEWYHFRKVRLKLTDRRIRELEEQVRALETSATEQEGDPAWSPRAYRRPGVFLEGEELGAEGRAVVNHPPTPPPNAVPDFAQAAVRSSEADPDRGTVRPDRRETPSGTGRIAASRTRQAVLETLRRNSELMGRGTAPRTDTPPHVPPQAPPQAPVEAPFQTDDEEAEPAKADAQPRAIEVMRGPEGRAAWTRTTRVDNGLSARDVPLGARPAEDGVDAVRQRWSRDVTLTQRTQEFPDDLSKIKGIGDVYKQRLYRAGFCTWRQIAEADLDKLRQATGAYPSSNVEDWPVQARALMEKHGRVEAVYRGPAPDDLTKILGIGPVGASTLYRAGVCTYEQLAMMPRDELAQLFPIAVAGDLPDFAGWAARAAHLADEKHRG